MYINKGNKFLLLMQPSSWRVCPTCWISFDRVIGEETCTTCGGPTVESYKVPMRAVVRSVVLRPLGNFMMGLFTHKGKKVSVSGAYGGDGLPMRAPLDLYLKGLQVPDDLVEVWNTGGGHNGAGREAPAMRKWARANLKELTR